MSERTPTFSVRARRLGALAAALPCLATCSPSGAPKGMPPKGEPLSVGITAIFDHPASYRGVAVRVRGWTGTGFRECNFSGRRCADPPRILACERATSEQVTVDRPAVVVLELRSADGSPIDRTPGAHPSLLTDGTFHEVVGVVHADGPLALWLSSSARRTKASADDCLPPTRPGGSR